MLGTRTLFGARGAASVMAGAARRGCSAASTPPLVRSRVYASRGLAWRQTAGGGLPAERLLEGIDAQGMLDERMSLEWSSAEPSRISPVRNRVLPPWVGSGSRPDRLEKTASEALAAKLAAATPLTLLLLTWLDVGRAED